MKILLIIGSLALTACNSGASNGGGVPDATSLPTSPGSVGGYSYKSESITGGPVCTRLSNGRYSLIYTVQVSISEITPAASIEAVDGLPANWSQVGNCTTSNSSTNPSCTFTLSDSAPISVRAAALPLQINGSVGAEEYLTIPSAECGRNNFVN